MQTMDFHFEYSTPRYRRQLYNQPTSLKALLTTHLGAYHLIMMSSLRPQLLITAYDMYWVEIIYGNLQLKMIS